MSENADPEPTIYQYDGASELELNLIREFEQLIAKVCARLIEGWLRNMKNPLHNQMGNR